jgi:hypothetical protein
MGKRFNQQTANETKQILLKYTDEYINQIELILSKIKRTGRTTAQTIK